MSNKKILCHPDKNKITRMLLRGEGVRKVSKIINEMYPNDKKKHISVPTLQKFRKEHLKIEGEVLNDIKNIKLKPLEDQKDHTKLKRLSSYKEKLEEAANLHIEIKTELQEMFILLKTRMESLFDRLQSGNATSTDEQNFNKYFTTWIGAIEKQAKYIEKIADHTVETTNVNITVIEDQMSVLREAVRETMLEEMPPNIQIRFLEKLDKKMKDLNYRRGTVKIENIHKDVMELSKKIEDVKIIDGD